MEKFEDFMANGGSWFRKTFRVNQGNPPLRLYKTTDGDNDFEDSFYNDDFEEDKGFKSSPWFYAGLGLIGIASVGTVVGLAMRSRKSQESVEMDEQPVTSKNTTSSETSSNQAVQTKISSQPPGMRTLESNIVREKDVTAHRNETVLTQSSSDTQNIENRETRELISSITSLVATLHGLQRSKCNQQEVTSEPYQTSQEIQIQQNPGRQSSSQNIIDTCSNPPQTNQRIISNGMRGSTITSIVTPASCLHCREK